MSHSDIFDKKIIYLKNGAPSFNEINAKCIILATGCREKTREMIHIPGTRPSGIFSAGLAQKMINIEGWLPGKEVVIIGSGDIGLIMARRFTLEGAKVKAIVEIQDKSRGLARNIAQCVEDFDIPIYYNHRVSKIYGNNRVESVDITTGDNHPINITCDTILVSVGLIPERDLLDTVETQNIASLLQSNGIYISGNANHVYDIVDNVTADSIIAGKQAADYIKNGGSINV